ANREYIKGKTRIAGNVSSALEMLLCDAQTSGGLLVAVPGERVDAYLKSIREKGVREASVIGEVLSRSDRRIVVRS
ncbi:MAG: selenide, water dikinase SelD, partial [Candidatus Krumholzibacteria bacterium]|nr:selenide, water dikinase SelD [Candidatus Krumholzibacteria bacterium]